MSKHLRRYLHASLALAFLISIALVQSGLAASSFQRRTPEPDEIRRGYNTQTGKLSFVGGDRGQPLLKMEEVGAQSAEAAGMAVIRRYAGQFGVQDPGRNLRLDRIQEEAGGTTLRYQQEYRGVPVVGGEMVINTDETGNVLSLNGEVSPDLALPSVTPSISAEAARQIAMAGMQAWHGIAPDHARSTDPELWIYDERIFHESDKPAILVWRLELSPLDLSKPVHEFVLVDARTGEIALHFNQVDTSWNFQQEEPTQTPTSDPIPTETPTPEIPPTEEPTPTETPSLEPTSTYPTPEATGTVPPQESGQQETPAESGDASAAQSGVIRYVGVEGIDSGECTTPQTACKTIAYAAGQSTGSTTIYVSGGVFTSKSNLIVQLDNLIISGGWDTNYTIQNQRTVLDGSNRAYSIYIQSKNVQFSNLTIQNFHRGIYVQSQGEANLERIGIIRNSTGIYNAGIANLLNTTISGNLYDGVNNNGKMKIDFSTIAHNVQTGIYSYKAEVTIQNSILARNGSDCSQSINNYITSAGYNIFTGSYCSGTLNSTKKATDQTISDFYVSPLINNNHHALPADSPAVDKIPYTDSSSCPAEDVRGVSRPVGTSCDIGSYEHKSPGQAMFVQIGSGANQASGTERPYLEPLQALVYDAWGSPVPGVSVTFTSPSSGPTAVSVGNGNLISERITNERGIATIDIIANQIPGDFSIAATIPDQNSTALFFLSNLNIYLSPSGSDTNNECRNPGSPCKSLQYSLTKAKANATIYLAGGTYGITNTVIDLNNIWILGGWNPEYTFQNSQTRIKGKGYTLTVKGKFTKINNVILLELATGLEVGGLSTVLENVSITNNEIGIYNFGQLTITNSTISGNKITGVRNVKEITLVHTTIVNNLGSAIEQSETIAQFYLQNSIIAPLQNCYLSLGSFYSLGHNLLNPECGSAINRQSTDIISSNPKISPLINGYYHALLPGSPAIDVINLDLSGASCLLTDQRGISRPSGSKCDIGAYEYKAPANPVKLLIHNGSEQTIGPLQMPILPLEVMLLDEVGSPVSGVFVTFVSPSSGPSGSFNDISNSTMVTSNDSGIASITTYRANTLPGSYNLQIEASGMDTSLLFPLSNGNNLYVSTQNSNDTANDCRNINLPCKTLKRATDVASSGDTIYVASGYYPNVYAVINKSLYLSGGWNENFTAQYGITLQEQLTSNPQLTINASALVHIDRFDFIGGSPSIKNDGALLLKNSSFRKGCRAVNNTGLADIRNVTISENSCSYNYPAGIINISGQIQLTNVTITSNTGFDAYLPYNMFRPGGGIHNIGGRVVVKNSILTNNRTNLGFECSGIIHSQGNNIVSISDGCDWISADGDMLGTLSKPIDARLAGLTTNEEGPFIRPPLKDSPAIDAADQYACPSTDQIGQPRPNGSGCDIGAFEGFVVDQSKPYAITYTAKNYFYWPGFFVCKSPGNNCTGGQDIDADLAHTHALNFLQFMLDRHKRNGVEGAGYPLISTVHHGDENFQNAFWTNLGFQIVYGDGFSKADDVVAHEIMHGMTRTSSNLFYFYQSGAINESLSDLWGEYYDQLNGMGNDSAAVKWLIGEDLPGSIGVIRNMKNPPAFKDPDKMTSIYYYKGSYDNGGVHWNSGVNNKAVYLMVDGGTFNGRTVNGIGWEKTAAIYYYAQTRLLTSASDFADLQNALDQACTSLTGGTEGITTNDCNQVRNATMAVEMNKFPIPNFNPDVSYCPTGYDKYPTDLYLDDFENGASNWEFDFLIGNNRWSIVSSDVDIAFATSGDHALFGNDYDTKYEYEQRSDTRAIMANGVKIPTSLMTMLHFNHAFGFEWYFDSATGTSYYIDGAIVEYSTDGGVTWKDAKSLFSDGRNYNGTIYNDTSYGYNPLRNRAGFVGDSHGYVSSRYNLSSLAGKTVRFRFRMGTDKEYSNLGWFIDDVRIYTCIGAAAVPVLGTPVNSSLTTNFKPKLDWYNTDNADHYELEVATDAAFTHLIFSKQDVSVSEYTFTTALPANTRYYWRVRAVNQINAPSAWSTAWYFRTALTPPSIEAPANGSTPDSLRPPFSWTVSPGADSYSLVISTFSNFSSPLVDLTGNSTAYTPTVDLPANVPIYWRVRANGANTSAWTSASFTSPNPPAKPVLSAPANNANLFTYTPTLKWNAATVPVGAPAVSHYHLQFDNDADFSSSLYDQLELSELSFTIPDELPANQKFYWRVKAINILGQYSAWSTRSIRTAIVAPVLCRRQVNSSSMACAPLLSGVPRLTPHLMPWLCRLCLTSHPH
jgi:Zn-dependent metalloprotease